MTTKDKEIYSMRIIKENGLISKFFPKAEKLEIVTDAERQLAGIDLIVTTPLGPINIDVKCNYEENITYRGVAIEIKQNGILTLKEKQTDYQLHIWKHKNGVVDAYLLYYPEILHHYTLLKKCNIDSAFISSDIKPTTTKMWDGVTPTGECIIYWPSKGDGVCTQISTGLKDSNRKEGGY